MDFIHFSFTMNKFHPPLTCCLRIKTSKNLVICNHSMCNDVWLNVTYNYEWLPMWLFFKCGWILVFLLINYDYDLFHLSNRLIFHDVFVFFTTSYIRLIGHVKKKSHYSCIRYVCYLIVTRINYLIVYMYLYVYTYLLNTYLPIMHIPSYLIIRCLPTYLITISTYIHLYIHTH
jgi:hypothetical protein